jgi:hypothetical protein
MKTLLLFLVLAFPIAASATDHKPIIKDGYVMRTIQQDAELRDWIEGSQRVNTDLQKKADSVGKELEKAKSETADLQVKIDVLAKHDQEQTAKADKLQKENSILAGRLDKIGWVLAACAGLLAWSLASKFAAALPPPYNLIGPIAAGLIVGGAVFSYLRFLL